MYGAKQKRRSTSSKRAFSNKRDDWKNNDLEYNTDQEAEDFAAAMQSSSGALQAPRMSVLLDPIMDLSGCFSTDHNDSSEMLADELPDRNGGGGGGGAAGAVGGNGAEHRKSIDSEFSTSHDDQSTVAKSPDFAERENLMVICCRVLVLVVLLLSAVIVASMSWSYMSSEEKRDYLNQFRNDAKELIRVSEQNAENIVGVLEIFSILLSTVGKKDNITWPLFTFQDFEQFGSHTRELSHALLLAFAPVVSHTTRLDWESYSVAHQGWIEDSFKLYTPEVSIKTRDITTYIHQSATENEIREEELELYSPIWQLSPPPIDTTIINYNLLNNPTFQRLSKVVMSTRTAVISEILDTEILFGASAPEDNGHPQSMLVLPVFEDSKDKESNIVGHVVAVLSWETFFNEILQDGHDGIIAVLRSCGQAFTYQLDGIKATFLGTGDLHSVKFDALATSSDFVVHDDDTNDIVDIDQDMRCEYTLNVYPSAIYKDEFDTNRPRNFTLGVVAVFSFSAVVFIIFDCYVRKRQRIVNSVAMRSNAIVTSLFPAQVRDKLFQDERRFKTDNPFKRIGGEKGGGGDKSGRESLVPLVGGAGGLGYDDDDDILGHQSTAPIADLFPSATVLFMDIAGFTAWSSAREPSQVFVLLETIYRNFDKVAKRRRVFKVETIGDCYVAVCGLPEPCEDHAVVMARFARDCLDKMSEMTRKLESTLGPDTGDLAMRVGMHSGPVTAGVLRGDRARFQLFGDTVNTAARMESNGIRKKIQVSQETAELIIASGKSHWIKPREELVVAKGKGELQTYWLLAKGEAGATTTYSQSDGAFSEAEHVDAMDWINSLQQEGEDNSEDNSNLSSLENSFTVHNERLQRLVEYNCDILLQLLKKIVSKRQRMPKTPSRSHKKLFGGSNGSNGTSAPHTIELDMEKTLSRFEDRLGKSGPCLNEVVEIINLPDFDAAAYDDETRSHDAPEINGNVAGQLCTYVEMIASMYRENPFHNFDHASHVTQSTSKLLSRIVATKHIEEMEKMHDHTYGITSDPLTQFAVVLSSLIHDVDHRGVPNFLLVKEDPSLGAMYHNQAVAEQNSVDVAWNLLMDTTFTDLRRTIYTNECEMRRFRQLIVNSIMATDIFDKELAALRRKRWETAFHPPDERDLEYSVDGLSTQETKRDDSRESINRKATIVIEHIIQASDVAHTMQHWHMYTKFNERLYHEMFLAYAQGRSDKDPTPGWYKGELWFFDNYVIPLANKLKECGVFGVSGDEYLNYALANRNEWERKGKDIVESNHKRYMEAHKRGSLELGHSSKGFNTSGVIMPVPEG